MRHWESGWRPKCPNGPTKFERMGRVEAGEMTGGTDEIRSSKISMAISKSQIQIWDDLCKIYRHRGHEEGTGKDPIIFVSLLRPTYQNVELTLEDNSNTLGDRH